MRESTKNSYRKLAKHFYQTYLPDQAITPKAITDALKNRAPDLVPAYWRRLRNALEFDQRDQGFDKAGDRIKATKNPVTSDPKKKNLIKKKRRKVKNISEQDEQRLIETLRAGSSGDKFVYAAIFIVKHLGCRPSEIADLEFLQGGKVRITSTKKRDDRGLDRELKIENRKLYIVLQKNHLALCNADYVDPIVYVQKRLDKITKKLWPKRKVRPTLYSWRHQMGGDLKASGKSRREIAAIMGHRSQQSVDVYGHPKHCRSNRGYVTATPETINRVSSKKPSTAPTVRKKSAKSITPSSQKLIK